MKLYFGEHAMRTLLLLSIIGFLAIIEYFIAKRKKVDMYSSDQTLANFWLLFINANLNFAVFGIFLFSILTFFRDHGLHLVDNLSHPIYWGLLFILQDFCYYWQHRYVHECRLGWASHVTHHSSDKLNLTVVIREGSTYFISLNWVFWIPLCYLGFKTINIIAMQSILIFYQTFIHNELVGKLGILDLIFNTPSNHRVHHASNKQYLDKNYGAVFIIWDRIFGTFALEKEKPIFGITKPVTSSNPLYLMFHEWYAIFYDIVKQKSWKPLIFMPKSTETAN